MWDASLRLGRERTDHDGEHALQPPNLRAFGSKLENYIRGCVRLSAPSF